jgi:Ca2+-binding RTX toxin-like protein
LKHESSALERFALPLNRSKRLEFGINAMSRILGSQELINGKTQQYLADRWSAQTLSTSNLANPFTSDDTRDPLGKRGSVERHENFQLESPQGVAFIGGAFAGQIDSPVVRTIVGRPDTVYFAPFSNQLVDNTTDNFSPDSPFPGGYALTDRNLNDLLDRGLQPRDPSGLLGEADGTLPTLLDVAGYIANFIDGQFVQIDGIDRTPGNLEDYRQETDDSLSYDQLPRATGAFYISVYGSGDNFFVADPDLGENLDNDDFSDDIFPTFADLDPSLKKAVLPFVQAGDYFGVELCADTRTIQFGSDSFGQDATYNILNPVDGTNGKDDLIGTPENDYLDGKNGADSLLGVAGDDLLIGGNGKDVLDGGLGSDELWGDRGNDLFVYAPGYGTDKIFDLEPGEVVNIQGFTASPTLTDITLPSGVNATEIHFNTQDILTLVDVASSNVLVDLAQGTISSIG